MWNRLGHWVSRTMRIFPCPAENWLFLLCNSMASGYIIALYLETQTMGLLRLDFEGT